MENDALLKKYVSNIAKSLHKEIVNHPQYKMLKTGIKANQFRIELLNLSHFDESIEILAHAFSKGGGNYEVIKNLEKQDLISIAKGWINLGYQNGLSFVLLDNNNCVAFVGINEIIGYDQNVSNKLILTKNGKLRQQLRNEFEKNDPFWQYLMTLNLNNKLKYGKAMAGIGASRKDLQGHPSLSTLAFRFWDLFLRGLYNKNILRWYVNDATHWKTIALMEYAMNISQKKFGKTYTSKTSEFDVNKYIQKVNNKNDFVYNKNIKRRMCMYRVDYTVGKSKDEHWTDSLDEIITAGQFTSNTQIYNKSKL